MICCPRQRQCARLIDQRSNDKANSDLGLFPKPLPVLSGCRVFTLGLINNLNWKKARHLSNLLLSDLQDKRKLEITQLFVDQVGVYFMAPGNERGRNTRRASEPTDRDLFLLRPEPLLLARFARNICPQHLHYQW